MVAAVLVAFLLGKAEGDAGPTPPAPARPAGPGPARVVAGIPQGFAHTRAGAAAAVTAYTALLANPATLLDDSARAHALAVVATPAYAARFAAAAPQLRKAAKAFPPVYVAVPISYRVTAFAPAQATVTGWGVTVAGGTSAPPTATWGTSRATVVWSQGDWRLAGAHTTTGPAPAPAAGQRPAPGSAFLAALRASRELRHVP